MKYLISITGPTAAGKTAFSIHLAKMFGTEILSADSRQIYRQMDIGTAKASPEELDEVPHHLIDHLNPKTPYSAGTYRREAEEVLNKIWEERFVAVAAGGSGLYLKALWEGFDEIPPVPEPVRVQVSEDYVAHGLSALVAELAEHDPATHEKTDLANPARVMRAIEVFRATGKPISSFRKGEKKGIECRHIKIGLTMDRPVLYDRINQRVDKMVEAGLEEEVKGLYDQYGAGLNALQTVGYQEWFPYFEGERSREEVIELIKRNTRRFAKRQYTWFRRYEDIAWFEADEWKEMEGHVLREMGLE